MLQRERIGAVLWHVYIKGDDVTGGALWAVGLQLYATCTWLAATCYPTWGGVEVMATTTRLARCHCGMEETKCQRVPPSVRGRASRGVSVASAAQVPHGATAGWKKQSASGREAGGVLLQQTAQRASITRVRG